MNEIHEECGAFGIWAPEKTSVGRMTYCGLFALQHRGQEAAGIAVNEDRTIRCIKDLGLVSEVFDESRLKCLGEGRISVGHVRYSTSGADSVLNAQPILVRHVKGQLALCHNGNLTNSAGLRRKLELKGCIFQTTSDTEVIAYIIIQNRLRCASIEEAVCRSMKELEGAYSLIMSSPEKLIAARDPHGLRPLCYGVMKGGLHVFASETCALDSVGASYIRDVEPGEVITVDSDGVRSNRDFCGMRPKKLCIFEHIYFARADSVIDGAPVHESRKRAGIFLAEEHSVDADVVIGVPDSGIDAALGFAQRSGIPFGCGLLRNKYIGRTFIAPEQGEREDLVRMKLNPIRSVVEGKRVVMIDDSIVRGTTSRRIVSLLKEAGAKEVHVRISSPPFMNPCYYGTDVDSRKHLIACSLGTEGIREMIGADSLGFLSLYHARRIVPGADPESFCAACFDGQYPTEVPEEAGKMRMEFEKTDL